MYNLTQRRVEVEFESLFSNCDFSYKQKATDHRRSSQDGRRVELCCKDFCANENLFCTLFLLCESVFYYSELFLQWRLSCVYWRYVVGCWDPAPWVQYQRAHQPFQGVSFLLSIQIKNQVNTLSVLTFYLSPSAFVSLVYLWAHWRYSLSYGTGSSSL